MRTVDPERHAARRRQILDGAAMAFAHRGFDNTTVKDLCASAGVGSGTLFHYFVDKRAVFHAILEDDRDRTIADLGAITVADPDERLWSIVERLTTDLRDPAAGPMMLAILGQLTVDPRVGEILGETDTAAEAALGAAVAVLAERGEVDGWTPKEAATWIRSIIDGLHLRCADDGFAPDAEIARLHFVIAQMLGLRSACGQPA